MLFNCFSKHSEKPARNCRSSSKARDSCATNYVETQANRPTQTRQASKSLYNGGMQLQQVWQFLVSHQTHIVSALMAFVFVWQSVPKDRRDEWEKQWPRLIGLIRIVVELSPALRGAYEAFYHQIVKGEAKTEVVKRQSSPPTPPAAPLTAILFFVWCSVFALAIALAGCPVYERETCGTPRAYTCTNNQPYVCSPSGRWTPVGDTPCSAQGTSVCALNDAGIAYCTAP